MRSNFLKYSRWLLMFFAVVNCSMVTKKKEPISLSYPPELEAVHRLITERKTDDARLKIDDYLNRSENIHWFGHAYFLKGFLFELDEKLVDAAKLYRSAIQHSSAYNAKVEAKALYNLSFVYEKMAKNDELLLSLVDLMKRREFFDILTGQVEIPARLAAAYAAQSKMKEAIIFQREASGNFKSIVRTVQFRASKEEISKSLYYLGLSVLPAAKESFEFLVRKLSYGQAYYLGSAEASKSSWSEKSTAQLLDDYQKVWSFVKGYQTEGFEKDLLAKKKNTQSKQLVMASQFYDLVHHLRAEEFPMTQVNKNSKLIMDASQKWLEKIEAFAMSLDLGPVMTRNKAIKNTKLANFIQKKHEPVKVNKEKIEALPLKTGAPLPAKLPPKEGIGSDPNL